MVLHSRFISALHASFLHALASVLVAILAAILVFAVWYPWPLYEIVGGRELFWLVIGVDVVCGPLLTLVLWNPKKPQNELVIDLTIVAAIQMAALAYGMHTVAVVRPVHLIFEVDRIRVVTASEVEPTDLLQAQAGFQKLPWTGPTLASIRAAHDGEEFIKSVDLSIKGQDPSLRPSWWQEYALGLPQLLKRARSLETLAQARPTQKALLDEAVRKSGSHESDLLWLPLTSARSMEWVILLDKSTGQPRGYAPIDGFF